MRGYVMPLALVACGAWLSVAASAMAPAEPSETAAPIDFEVLHSQAKSALDNLQQAQFRRSTVASSY